MKSINPATGETIATYDEHDDTGVEERLSNARDAFEEWQNRSVAECEAKLADVAALLRDRTDEYAD